jgi:hypothetical protein
LEALEKGLVAFETQWEMPRKVLKVLETYYKMLEDFGDHCGMPTCLRNTLTKDSKKSL